MPKQLSVKHYSADHFKFRLLMGAQILIYSPKELMTLFLCN